MIACLDLHDFSVVQNRLALLWKLKDNWPNFKVSLFTVPIDRKEDWGASLNRKTFLQHIQSLDWIQIIPHGLTHEGSEVKNLGYLEFKDGMIPEITKQFELDGLRYEKGFCAPHWRWNGEVVKALDDMGWWGAIDPRQPLMPSPKRFYKYTHCINEPLEGEVLKLHGHIYGTKNDLGECIDNLLSLPRNIEWKFVTDFIET